MFSVVGERARKLTDRVGWLAGWLVGLLHKCADLTRPGWPQQSYIHTASRLQGNAPGYVCNSTLWALFQSAASMALQKTSTEQRRVVVRTTFFPELIRGAPSATQRSVMHYVPSRLCAPNLFHEARFLFLQVESVHLWSLRPGKAHGPPREGGHRFSVVPCRTAQRYLVLSRDCSEDPGQLWAFLI